MMHCVWLDIAQAAPGRYYTGLWQYTHTPTQDVRQDVAPCLLDPIGWRLQDGCGVAAPSWITTIEAWPLYGTPEFPTLPAIRFGQILRDEKVIP